MGISNTEMTNGMEMTTNTKDAPATSSAKVSKNLISAIKKVMSIVPIPTLQSNVPDGAFAVVLATLKDQKTTSVIGSGGLIALCTLQAGCKLEQQKQPAKGASVPSAELAWSEKSALDSVW